MIMTTDGGNSWELMTAGCNDNLKSVCFVDENIGIAVGENGTILFTEKGGQQWEKIAIDINTNLNRVFMLNRHCMYAAGMDGLVLFSKDGRQWQSRSIEIDRHLYDVHFNTPDSGWVCGYSKNVYMTTDGGLSWNPQWVGGSGDYPNYQALCCDGGKELWTVGWYGNIVGTFDGGESWNHINPGIRSDLRRISFYGSSAGRVSSGVRKTAVIHGLSLIYRPKTPSDQFRLSMRAMSGFAGPMALYYAISVMSKFIMLLTMMLFLLPLPG